MKFGSFELDITALAALVTAITTAYMAIKGRKLRNKKRKEDTNDAE